MVAAQARFYKCIEQVFEQISHLSIGANNKFKELTLLQPLDYVLPTVRV